MRTVDPGTGTDAEPDYEESSVESGETAGPSRRPLVLSAVAGFVLGASVLGLLWGLSGYTRARSKTPSRRARRSTGWASCPTRAGTRSRR
jgi:hypothetical protein